MNEAQTINGIDLTANVGQDRASSIGILGFGGLGQAAARVLAAKKELKWIAAADRSRSPTGPWSRTVGPPGSTTPLSVLSRPSTSDSIASADPARAGGRPLRR